MGQIQRGQLRCMLRAGRLKTALDKASMLLSSAVYEAGTMAQITAGAVEACWKLGQWEELGQALNKVSESTADQPDGGAQLWVLSPHVGAIVLAIHTCKWKNIRIIRSSI